MSEPEATQNRLARDLTAVGVRSGGVLLVHSSLSSMGHVPNGPETVIRGLLEAVGARGTLLMPALSYAHVHANQPVFDVATTPSTVGAIPEFFRTRADTLRSGSPTHSVCGVGPGAADIVCDHHLDHTPCGERSPFRKLRDLEGQVLFLGCGMSPNTSMHGVEELSEPPYLFSGEVAYQVILGDGEKREVVCRRHNFAGWVQRYERVGPLLRGEEIRTGPVLAATAHLLEASAMWERAHAAMVADPYYFVSKSE